MQCDTNVEVAFEMNIGATLENMLADNNNALGINMKVNCSGFLLLLLYTYRAIYLI